MSRRRPRASQKARPSPFRPLIWISLSIGGVILVALGVMVALSLRQPSLPPTRFGPAHVEVFPPERVLSTPIPFPVQEHLLEHGCGPFGRASCVLIQYNCEDYPCPPDLTDRLARFAEECPRGVYVAPLPGMDAFIALTTFNQIETLEEYDEEAIRAFVDRFALC